MKRVSVESVAEAYLELLASREVDYLFGNAGTDFSPLIEGTPTGEVSDTIEVTSDSDRQFDISNTSTATLVLTRGSLTLQGNSAYTFFMTDNGTTPIGVLRRDR